MANRCNVANCKGNYRELKQKDKTQKRKKKRHLKKNENTQSQTNKAKQKSKSSQEEGPRKARVFKLPNDELERQKWIDVLPPRQDGFKINPATFHICERHWPSDAPMKVIPGGHTVPAVPPSIFNVPPSCLPTPKPGPRTTNAEDKQLKDFYMNDKIKSFAEFLPEKNLRKKYRNLIISRTKEKFVCLFMSEKMTCCNLSIIVENRPTLCSPLIMSAYKKGINVSISKLLNPNNGLLYYSQFFESVHLAYNYVPPLNDVVDRIVSELENQITDELDDKVNKKLVFLTRQLKLLVHKEFSMADYCFAVESYPRCDYEQLRDVLVLPSKRKLQAIVNSTEIDEVLKKTFDAVKAVQKNVMLLVDEVKIRPTVAFSGGELCIHKLFIY